MKNTLTIILVLLLANCESFAQKNISGSVKGTLADTSYREILADATVSVLNSNTTDSSVVSYTRADEKGAFVIKNLAEGTYRLVVSYQSYLTLTKKFTISPASPDVNLGEISMTKFDGMLEEIIVERPPITVKGDTVEFSAGAFKTKPNAKAEDLLKKLPGVEVDKDGAVTAQGEAVQKIYVDGKEFFGSDPKMATRNITADMIESVQVFDDMSEQAKFTRIDDGSRSKTINIKLKKNMKQGYFGRATVGYGTDDRYTANIMLNRFNNDRRISLIGASNNLNKQGFNSRDLVGNMGGFAGGGGRGGGRGGGGMAGGINTSSSGGINYTDVLGKVDVQGSYMYSETKNRSNQTSSRRNDFPTKDSISVANQVSASNGINRNHNFNFKIEYEIDSMNSILYTPTLSLQNSTDVNYDSSATFITAHEMPEYLGLSNVNRTTSERKGISLSNELLYRRRFNKPGRTFTLGYKNSVNNSDGNGQTYSPITFYNPAGGQDSIRQQDFISAQETKSSGNVISTSYTEPIGKNKILEFNYAYTNNESTSDRTAFSYNPATKLYDSINAPQTNYFENSFIAHRMGFNFRYRNKIYGFQLGGSMQSSDQDNNSIRASVGKDSIINTRQKAVNFFPTANFNYDFTKRKNIKVSYQGRTNQPNVRQLQDVRDVSNPLRITEGNPNLKQEFNNKLNIAYKTFNETTFRYLNANVNYNATSNRIVNSIDSLPGKGVQLIRPVNLAGAFDASYDISFGLPLRQAVKGSSIILGNRMGYNRGVSRLYGDNNFTNTFNASQSAGLNLDIKEKVNLELRARGTYHSVIYSSQQQDQKYFTQNYSTDISYFPTSSLILSTDFDYMINTGRAAGFNQNVPLWNAGVAYQIFKKKNGEIKLTVNDLLNQNSNIDRTVRDNYIEDTRTVILQRYFLLTFTYNFNQFGKRGQGNKRGEREFQMERGERVERGGGGQRGGFGGGRGGGRNNF